MNGYTEHKSICKKCGKLIAVVLIGAAGAEVLQQHECRNVKTELWCRAPADMESNNNPYGPINPGLRIGIATTTGTTGINTDVFFSDLFQPPPK